MPISSTVRKTSPFTGNGSITALPFTFKVFATTDVQVIRTTTASGAATVLTPASDFTATLNADQDTSPGGTVTLTTALAVGYTAMVVSAIPQTQPVSLLSGGGFVPSVITRALDRNLALQLQLAERVSRTPALPVNDTTIWPEIPMPVGRINTVIGFGATGAPELIPLSTLSAPVSEDALTVSLNGVSALLATSFTLSMTVEGTIPSGAAMRIEWTDNVSLGPWRSSTQTAATPGVFSWAFTGAPAETTLHYRGVVYTIAPPPSGSVSTVDTETIHAISATSSFETPASGGGALSLTLGSPASVTATSFTLPVTVGGTIPSGALTLIQWTDDPANGPWRESARVPSTAGVYSFAFSNAPPDTTITWRAFVFNEPATIHIQTAPDTFDTDPAASTSTYSFLFIGDSLFNGDDSYSPPYYSPRGDFQSLLTAAGVSHTMIGPYSGGGGNGPDGDHGAVGGRSIAQIKAALDVILSGSYDPDVIVLQAGWNDQFIGGATASGSPDALEDLYDDIRTRKPSAHIALCTLSQPDEPFPYLNANYVAINDRARTIAAANSSTTTLCDLAEIEWISGDLADYVHYSTAGAAKIAARIFADLLADDVFAVGEEPSDTILTTLISHMGAQQLSLPNLPSNAGWRLGATVVKGCDWRAIANPSWWGYNPRTDLGAYWRFLIPWTVVWDITGHQDGLNTRYAERNCELWVLHDDNNVWERVSVAPTPGGAAFQRNMLNPTPGNLDTRTETDGSFSVRFGPQSEYVWHGWGTFGSTTRPERAIAAIARVQVRKTLHNSGGTDDRASARYAVQVGADPYPAIGSPEMFGAGAYNPGMGTSRFVEVTNDWQWVYFSTLASPPTYNVDGAYAYNSRQTITQALLAANLPPL